MDAHEESTSPRGPLFRCQCHWAPSFPAPGLWGRVEGVLPVGHPIDIRVAAPDLIPLRFGFCYAHFSVNTRACLSFPVSHSLWTIGTTYDGSFLDFFRAGESMLGILRFFHIMSGNSSNQY